MMLKAVAWTWSASCPRPSRWIGSADFRWRANHCRVGTFASAANCESCECFWHYANNPDCVHMYKWSSELCVFLYKFKFGVKGLSKASQGVAGMLVFWVKGILGWGVYYVNDKDFYIIVTYMEAHQAVSKAINHKL